MVDITAGNDFAVVFEYFAVLPGIGIVPLNDVAQPAPGGQTRSSIGTAWYGTVVPEPSTALLVAGGLGALAASRRRFSRRSAPTRAWHTATR